MKKVLLLWRQIHYNFYKFNCFTQIYVIGLPFTLFLKIKAVNEFYKRRGIKDPSSFFTRKLTNPQTSTVNWLTDGIMIFLIASITFSILNFITVSTGYMIWADWSFFIFLILIGLPSVLVNYFVLWKDDKYLVYYKEFEKQSKEEKRKWAWISFITVLLIILLLILSFKVMTDNIHK
jgi:hypothetical protein